MSAVVVFLRHGESAANVADFINDDPARSVPLTARGIDQARTAAALLRGRRFCLAFASEFPRARQTARILLAHHSLPLAIDARLNERRSGMDGLPCARFSDLVRADPVNARPANGETFVEQMARLRAFLDHVAALRPDGPVLAVSHENPILAARAVAGLPAEQAARGRIANCEWIELRWPG